LVKYGKFEDGTFIHQKVKSIALSGLGTGVGQVAPLVCARQMRIAWEDVMHEKHATKEDWDEMRANYAYFYTHNSEDLKYDIP
jgi:O-acetyl-ADP-ribose deacetylase (regulator of RNase III)